MLAGCRSGVSGAWIRWGPSPEATRKDSSVAELGRGGRTREQQSNSFQTVLEAVARRLCQLLSVSSSV